MSYFAKLYFKKDIKNLNEFSAWVEKLSKSITLNDYLEIRKFYFKDEIVDKIENDDLAKNILMVAVQNFTTQVFYWEKYEMAAILWQYQSVDGLKDNTDFSFIFQNSTDSDYSDDCYDGFPESLKTLVNDFSFEDVLNSDEWHRNDYNEAKSDEERARLKNYLSRTYRYDRLKEELNINRLFGLYGNNADSVEVASMDVNLAARIMSREILGNKLKQFVKRCR